MVHLQAMTMLFLDSQQLLPYCCGYMIVDDSSIFYGGYIDAETRIDIRSAAESSMTVVGEVELQRIATKGNPCEMPNPAKCRISTKPLHHF